jgi:hypothetical protein
MMNVIASNSGAIIDYWIANCWLSQALGAAVIASAAAPAVMVGLHVEDNNINNNNTAGASIFVGGNTTYFHVSGNIATRTAVVTMLNFVQIGLGTNEFIVTENIAHGVVTAATIADLSGAVSKVVANNL